MFDIVISIFFWCFFIYGILCLIQEVYRNFTYKKIEENIKLIMLVKNVEEGIENYVRELSLGRNFFNNLVIIDLESDDDTIEILKGLEKENINMKILNKAEGKKYLENIN